MSEESYKKVIDLLEQDIDFKAIAIDLAKKHPKAFAEAANRVGQFAESKREEARQQIDEECRRIWHDKGNKVEAIKHYRTQTGASLKEAKEDIESL